MPDLPKPKQTEFSITRMAPILIVALVLASVHVHASFSSGHLPPVRMGGLPNTSKLSVQRSFIPGHLPPGLQHLMGRKTVDDRLAEYGGAARARIEPLFAAAGVKYPPATVVLLALKDTDRMEVYAADRSGAVKPIAVYVIQAASGHAGPKLAEGDRQVPEGVYPIEALNPNSAFHLSMLVGYPNDFDQAQARGDGRSNLGGSIMIHGAQVSAGCLAMVNQTAEDLFVLAADSGPDNVKVIISPVDFRKTDVLPADGVYPAWSGKLYQIVKSETARLPIANPPLPVQTDPTATGLAKNRIRRHNQGAGQAGFASFPAQPHKRRDTPSGLQ